MCNYIVRAASRAGSKHDGLDANNQDAFGYKFLPDGGLAMVVCDGAGSQQHSRMGADLVVAKTLKFLTERQEFGSEQTFAECVRKFIPQLQETLRQKAEEIEVSVRDLSCTLLALVVRDGRWQAMQLGDGFIVWQEKIDLPYKLGITPMQGEYPNETFFVPKQNAADLVWTHESEGQPYFVCMSTDGLERLCLKWEGDSSYPYQPFFDALTEKVQPEDGGQEYLRCFLADPELDKKTDDDRTLVCAWLSEFPIDKENEHAAVRKEEEQLAE